jgi:hypothetical protein
LRASARALKLGARSISTGIYICIITLSHDLGCTESTHASQAAFVSGATHAGPGSVCLADGYCYCWRLVLALATTKAQGMLLVLVVLVVLVLVLVLVLVVVVLLVLVLVLVVLLLLLVVVVLVVVVLLLLVVVVVVVVVLVVVLIGVVAVLVLILKTGKDCLVGLLLLLRPCLRMSQVPTGLSQTGGFNTSVVRLLWLALALARLKQLVCPCAGIVITRKCCDFLLRVPLSVPADTSTRLTFSSCGIYGQSNSSVNSMGCQGSGPLSLNMNMKRAPWKHMQSSTTTHASLSSALVLNFCLGGRGAPEQMPVQTHRQQLQWTAPVAVWLDL